VSPLLRLPLPARGSSGAATCPRGSSSHSRFGAAPEPPRVPGLYGLQANKQISSVDPAIMIFIGAGTPISSNELRDKGCSARSQDMHSWLIKYRRDVWQVGCSAPSQCLVVQQLWTTGLLQSGVSDVSHLSATTMGLVTQRHSTVSKTECSMAGDKTRLAHAVEDIIGYSWPLCSTV
jgi:hypothetical protein